MVSEIQTEDDEMMDQLLKQGFLPLNTPVEKLGENSFIYFTFCLPTSSSAQVSYTDSSPFLYSPLYLFLCSPVKSTLIVSKMDAR